MGGFLPQHTGMWTASETCPVVLSSIIIKTGASARSTTFANQRRKKSTKQQRNWFRYSPKTNVTKFIVKQAARQLADASETVAQLKAKMNEAASKLPEYPVVMAMYGVGSSLGPQLMAEIGDVSRFTHKGALTAFAGVDPGVNESGSYEQKSVHVSKRGSAQLRKTLFQVMDCLIKNMPQDDPVYRFMDKKRTEGKPYYVYMTAGANKFYASTMGGLKSICSLYSNSNDFNIFQ